MRIAMGSVPVTASAIRFDQPQATGCNAGSVTHPTRPVKFLDLLNKPVRFRLRSTPRDVAGKDAAHSADPRSAHGVRARAAAADEAAQPASFASPESPRQSGEPDSLLARDMDEAALLFATGQPDAAIRLLGTTLAAPPKHITEMERKAWQMLLELHEAQSQRAGYDGAALAYAQRFETSPPQWRSPQPAPQMLARTKPVEAPLALVLRDSLDAGAQTIFSQWQQRSANVVQVTLELASVTAVTLPGCRLLLSLLADWQQRGMHVDLRPCDTLLAMLRELIQSGRRDEDDTGWRLLIELLRVAGDVERYEDACLAYSLTYEMSPPAAPPPVINDRNTLPNDWRPAHHPSARPGVSSDVAFSLPEIITMPIDPLLIALRAHARQTSTTRALVLDASRLQRIDVHAAGNLQVSLVELAAGKPVEWQAVSFLVSTLLQLTSGSTTAGIINRKP